MGKELEQGLSSQLDFSKLQQVASTGQQVIPAIAQNVDTGEIVMVGYANKQALDHALRENLAVFWSTSRNELWVKGMSSGDVLELIDVRINCEQNSILYRVRLKGKGGCHTHGKDGLHRTTCYYRRLLPDGKTMEFVEGQE